jgi:hypothetical protein
MSLMLRSIKFGFRAMALAAVAALFTGAESQATFLAPGTSVVPDANAVTGTVLQVLTDNFNVPLATGGADIGTLTVTAYRTTAATTIGATTFAAGTITFSYQLTVAANSFTSITGITAFDFAPGGLAGSVLTDVSAVNSGAGAIAPQDAFRTSADGGHVIAFDFGRGGAELSPGSTSQLLIVRTNALSFTAGNASVQGGGAITLAGFTPLLGAVPEPASFVMMGMGLVGALGAFRARSRTTA